MEQLVIMEGGQFIKIISYGNTALIVVAMVIVTMVIYPFLY